MEQRVQVAVREMQQASQDGGSATAAALAEQTRAMGEIRAEMQRKYDAVTRGVAQFGPELIAEHEESIESHCKRSDEKLDAMERRCAEVERQAGEKIGDMEGRCTEIEEQNEEQLASCRTVLTSLESVEERLIAEVASQQKESQKMRFSEENASEKMGTLLQQVELAGSRGETEATAAAEGLAEVRKELEQIRQGTDSAAAQQQEEEREGEEEGDDESGEDNDMENVD